MPTIANLKKWKNGEVFNARDYVYERDLILAQVNRLTAIIEGEGGVGTDISVNSITIGGRTLSYDETHGTLELGLLNDVTLHIGQEQYFYAKAFQSNITIGDPVMFAGVEGNHFRIQVATPEAINANPEYFMGVAAQSIAAGDFGYVIEFGHLEGVNLPAASYSLGDILWFDSTNGGYTKVKPLRGSAQVRVAAVISLNQNVNQTFTGQIFVRPSILEGGASETNVVVSNNEPQFALQNDLWFDTSNGGGE